VPDGDYGPWIGTRPPGVKWSRDHKRSKAWPHYLWGAISP